MVLGNKKHILEWDFFVISYFHIQYNVQCSANPDSFLFSYYPHIIYSFTPNDKGYENDTFLYTFPIWCTLPSYLPFLVGGNNNSFSFHGLALVRRMDGTIHHNHFYNQLTTPPVVESFFDHGYFTKRHSIQYSMTHQPHI